MKNIVRLSNVPPECQFSHLLNGQFFRFENLCMDRNIYIKTGPMEAVLLSTGNTTSIETDRCVVPIPPGLTITIEVGIERDR